MIMGMVSWSLELGEKEEWRMESDAEQGELGFVDSEASLMYLKS
jgi:hypothetical protein